MSYRIMNIDGHEGNDSFKLVKKLVLEACAINLVQEYIDSGNVVTLCDGRVNWNYEDATFSSLFLWIEQSDLHLWKRYLPLK